MKVEVAETPLSEVDAGLLCVPLFEDDSLPEEFASAPGSDDARAGYKKLALLRPGQPERVLVVGLGKRDDFDAERARVAAALAVRQAGASEATTVAWAIPDAGDPESTARALIEGTVLASYRFDRFRRSGEDEEPTAIDALTILGPPSLSEPAEEARLVAEAQNRARELQNLPSNVATPSYLAERATKIGDANDSVSVEVLDREEISALGMGGLIAVSRGTAEEPRLIVMRYSGAGNDAPALGLVGKGVTFDTGGISIKPSSKMHEMKMDMSGAAAVIEAAGAIAELGLGLNLVAIVPTTENMPSGTAVKPGDIITQYNGKTVEVNNTDAEGRLILADALAFCAEQEGVERIVDLATLTGAVLVALGSTYAALISNDDEFAAEVTAAAEATGELAWRLPLHPEYKELTKGSVADLTNASEKRKAGTIYAGSFLEEFVDGHPWAHLDIAGTAWDVGREYVGSGASGYGVRLLVELARGLAR